MEQDVFEEIINTVIPGAGFTRAGRPQLNDTIWTVPFHHCQFGLGQVFLPDREVNSTSDVGVLAKELREQLGWALASSQ